jgi:acetyl esterase
MTDHMPSGPLDPIAALIADYFKTDPVWQGMLTRPVADTRAAIKAGTPMSLSPAMAHVEDFRVPVEGGNIGLRLYRPVTHVPALIIWAHGGGFAFGSVDESDNFARALAAETGCAIASIDYRLAPEYKFPTAVNDVLAATLWVAARTSALAGRDVPLILGGDSAGANLATVVTRKLHAAQDCAIAGNVLAYPSTDAPDATSLRKFEPAFLTIAEMRWFLDQYLPDPAAHRHPDFAPLHAEDLALLPPSLIITAEHDIITAQAEAYGRRLTAVGVDVRTIRHPGMIHGFLTLDAFFPGAAGQAMRDIAAFIATIRGPVQDAAAS